MKELLPQIEQWRESGHEVAVATVVSAYGSAPRKAGAKMIVADDGQFVGSVSGGCVENDVVEHARQVLEEGQARLVPYGITDEMALNVGLACGGQIRVFIQPFGRAFPLEKPVAFVNVIRGGEVGKGLLAWESGKHRGSLGQGEEFDERVAADAIRLLKEARSAPIVYEDAPEGETEVFVDALAAQPTLYLFGAVHVAVEMARQAPLLGFRVVVIDPRESWLNHERFPNVDEMHLLRADDYLAKHRLGSNAFVAVLSHNPALDDPALLAALQSSARFVGAIGGGKTQGERRQRLAAEGLSDEQIGRLFGPVGMDIGAQNPEEIALSILAQMVAVKNGRLAPPGVKRDLAEARA